MCGFAGFLSSSLPADQHPSAVTAMVARVRHRGPDDSGIWCDSERGFALGHARLAVLDLSLSGHQPMLSHSGRYVIAYNGEVYNYRQLARELEKLGCSFRGTSDTEVMLEAIEAWGIEAALKRFVGMFAFALWDRQENSLTLVRDRIGIKPLYYGWWQGSLIFASELHAFKSFPGFAPSVNYSAIPLIVKHFYIPCPQSIYCGIYKLPPGSLLELSAGDLEREQHDFSPYANSTEAANYPRFYWSAAEMAERAVSHPWQGSAVEAEEHLDELLRTAVNDRLIADVPLGAFLSGGIDSSTVVALAQVSGNSKARTFSIGFSEAAYNEAGYAKQVAEYLGTDHTELYLSEREAQQLVPTVVALYDEPFADSSQLPTYLVSRLARQCVTVSLSGDGGDELFCGYPRYAMATKRWRQINRLPRQVRRLLALPLGSSVRAIHKYPGLLRWLGASSHRSCLNFLEYACLLSETENLNDVYDPYISASGALKLYGAADPNAQPLFARHFSWEVPCPPELQLQLLDLTTYLPDDILVKVDRASMACSLEVRVPILDHRIVEFVWSLPQNLKSRDGETKWLLRRVLRRYVPDHLVDRPKMGFGVPIGAWLRTSLRPWAEELLHPDILKKDGIFDVDTVRRAWQLHLDSSSHAQDFLWNVLMFQAWRHGQ